MMERWIMHIKRFVHLLTFRHTAYFTIRFFRRPFHGSRREHRKSSDKPPPADAGSHDGLLYVYHSAGSSPLRPRFFIWQGKTPVSSVSVSAKGSRIPLKFLNYLEDKAMWQRNNGRAEEELQIKFTGYLIQAVRRTQRDYLKALYAYSNQETLTDTIFAVSQTLEQEVMERLPLWEKIESGALLYALKQLDERERYVFLARVLDKRPFDVIGVQLGLSYKGAAAVYYRAIRKLKKSIEGVNGYDI